MSETSGGQQNEKSKEPIASENNADSASEEMPRNMETESLSTSEEDPVDSLQDATEEEGLSSEDPEDQTVVPDSGPDGHKDEGSFDVDESGNSDGEATGELTLIREDLGMLKVQMENLANPKSEELDRARRLILLLSAVTGIVMVASITFFVVMSVSISQKVSELDRVLMAVAKRGVQLGDGLIKISEMENKLVRVIEQNEPIPLSLERIESQVSNQGRTLIDKEEENFISLRSRFAPLIEKQNELELDMQTKFQELEVHVSRTFDLRPLTNENFEVREKLDNLSKEITQVKGKVNDLYAIKRAEMEKVFIELKNVDE